METSLRRSKARIMAPFRGLMALCAVLTVAVGSTKFEGATGTRWTFTATGPTTNLAARIGALASGGTIYVGETTAQRLAQSFELRDLGPQPFKNMREPVIVYEILDQRTLAETVSP